MSKFFIRRPIVAMVISIVMVIVGVVSMLSLDKQIIERVSAIGKVEPSWVEKTDEHASATPFQRF